jgi:two-component system cell cycle sensor histidine kinase/response regulator CckA
VSVAASGAEALAQLDASDGAVSIVVTDLTMPGMSGMELIEILQAQRPSLPIVAISGFAMDPSARQELDARGVTFLPKPFSSAAMAKTLAAATAGRRETGDGRLEQDGRRETGDA